MLDLPIIDYFGIFSIWTIDKLRKDNRSSNRACCYMNSEYLSLFVERFG